MTVTYTSHVATCSGFGCFWKLLFRWKGSIYKLIWPELLAYSCMYYLCNFSYRFALSEEQKRLFEKISVYCQYFSDLIPLSFVLGFYVSIVVQRWWEQYMSLPWPDSLALFVSTSMNGQDERSRLMRRTVMRYVNLTELITFIMISPPVKKRFPTLDHLVEAGFMTSNEQKIFEDLDAKTPHPKYWMPLVWAGSIIARARKEGRIRDDFAVKTILDEINRFRGLCGGLLNYDWISIPLVYTQVVTLAVYTFFISTIMGRQFLDPAQNIPNYHVDFYVPVFTLLQFFFYMGWLKVAESLVNPFGEDDDDFEINWLVDRNLQVSYLIVDEMHSEHPELIQDMYWDEVFPQELPYTIASEQFRREPPQGSTANVEVSEQGQEFLPLVEEENDEGIHETMSGITVNMEKGGTEAIDIIKKPRSARSSITGMGSSQPLSSRKPSLLSMLFHRMRSNSQDNVNVHRHGLRANTSNTSFRHGRRHRGLRRSASRMSSTSQVTCQSPDSLARLPNIMTQDSAIFRMSGLSLNTHGGEDVPTPRSKTRHNSCDDDEPIVIKIKRRDKDGRVITSQMSDESDNTCDPSKALLTGKQKRVGHSFLLLGDDEESLCSEKRPGLSDGTGLGSSASIRTSIFQGDGNEADTSEEERKERTTQKQGRSMANMNLKGLSMTIGSSKSLFEKTGSSVSFQRLCENSEEEVPQDEPHSPGEEAFLPKEPQRQDEISIINPVSPLHKSPPAQCEAGQSTTAFDGLSESSTNPNKQPSVSPIPMDESLLRRPFSGDLNVCHEDSSPKTSNIEDKYYVKTEPCSTIFQSNTDQQAIVKDTLETIIEGPLESIAEVENIDESDMHKCDISK